MAKIVVIGAGVVGLGAAMLLAGDGHQVTVLERDPAGPPDDPDAAWEKWQRPGLNQFRLPHAFLGGFREIVDTELAQALQAAGALRLDDPAAFAEVFHQATAESVEPWYRTTLATDRHRLGEIEAGIRGETYDSPDPWYQLEKALDVASGQDPDCLRTGLDVRLVLHGPDEVFARPGLREKTLRLGAGWRDEPSRGPDRQQLLDLVSAP